MYIALVIRLCKHANQHPGWCPAVFYFSVRLLGLPLEGRICLQTGLQIFPSYPVVKQAAPKQATVKVILDTRRALAGGAYPLKIQAVFRSRPYQHGTGRTATVEDWERVRGDSRLRSPELLALRRQVGEWQARAAALLAWQPCFDWPSFRRAWDAPDAPGSGAPGLGAPGSGAPGSGAPGGPGEVVAALRRHADALGAGGGVGSASMYETVAAEVADYQQERAGRRTVAAAEVTVAWLEGWERRLTHSDRRGDVARGKGARRPCSLATVGIYATLLRTIINDMVGKGLLAASPFGRRGYVIPTVVAAKKNVDPSDVARLMDLRLEGADAFARDFWILSYLSSGINPTDLLLMRWVAPGSDEPGLCWESGVMAVARRKTARTRRQGRRRVVAYLGPQTRAILLRWGTPPQAGRRVLPHLGEAEDPAEIKRLVRGVVRRVNLRTKRLGKLLGLDVRLTTYPARHSFVSALAGAGYSLSVIRDLVGHADEQTTRGYVGSLVSPRLAARLAGALLPEEPTPPGGAAR